MPVTIVLPEFVTVEPASNTKCAAELRGIVKGPPWLQESAAGVGVGAGDGVGVTPGDGVGVTPGDGVGVTPGDGVGVRPGVGVALKAGTVQLPHPLPLHEARKANATKAVSLRAFKRRGVFCM